MRASEIRQLIRLKPVELDATRRRLPACHDIAGLRAAGRRLTPRPGLRLRRRRGRRGAIGTREHQGAPAMAVPAARAGERVGGGHLRGVPRLGGTAAAGPGPDRVHPDGSPGRRDRRGAGGAAAPPAVHAVHDGDHDHRGGGRGRPGTAHCAPGPGTTPDPAPRRSGPGTETPTRTPGAGGEAGREPCLPRFPRSQRWPSGPGRSPCPGDAPVAFGMRA